MGRGFSFFNYMTYHTIRGYFKAKQEQKEAVEKFEIKNYKKASKAEECWIKSVRKLAEKTYGARLCKELHYGATQALLAICVEIYRNDHCWNEHRKILVDYIINSGTDGVTYRDFTAALDANANVRELIPLGWVAADGCGEFWTSLGHCLKKDETPRSKFTDLMDPMQEFISAFAFCGPLKSNVEDIATRFLDRATDGVNRGMTDPEPATNSNRGNVWSSGTSMESIQKMKVAWEHLLTRSNAEQEIDNPQLLLTLLIGKTMADIVVYGTIPAKDKLLEVEMVFAENRLQLGTTTKEFMLDIANHGDTWQLINKMMMPHDGQPPMFWQIAQIMSIKGNCEEEFDVLLHAFLNFSYCFVSEMDKKYPNCGYDLDKLLPYLRSLMPANAPNN